MILTIMCGYNIMCGTVTCLILIYFKITSQQTMILCGLIQLTTITPAFLTFDTICIISAVRYHMTWKINQLELFKKHQFRLSVGAVYFAEHIFGFFSFIIAQMDFSMIQPSTVCAGKDLMKSVPALGYIHLTKNIIVCSIGIIYDIRLLKLLKKRKMQRFGPGEIQIIPWKSSNASEPNVKVPIRATIAALSCISFGIVESKIAGIYTQSPIHWTHALITTTTLIGLLMPILLGLTFRAHKKDKNVVVPNYPMYHNDQFLNNDQMENEGTIDILDNNDIFMIDPNIFTTENFSDNDIIMQDVDEEAIEIHNDVIHVKPAPPY